MSNISKLPEAQDIADGICSKINPKNELIKTALLEFTKLHIKEYQKWLFEESKHGDEKRQQWLKDKIYSYPLNLIK